MLLLQLLLGNCFRFCGGIWNPSRACTAWARGARALPHTSPPPSPPPLSLPPSLPLAQRDDRPSGQALSAPASPATPCPFGRRGRLCPWRVFTLTALGRGKRGRVTVKPHAQPPPRCPGAGAAAAAPAPSRPEWRRGRDDPLPTHTPASRRAARPGRPSVRDGEDPTAPLTHSAPDTLAPTAFAQREPSQVQRPRWRRYGEFVRNTNLFEGLCVSDVPRCGLSRS